MAESQVDVEKSKDKEERLNQYITFAEGKTFGDWKVVRLLDEGGFGKVYLVERRGGKQGLAALKAEPNEADGGSAIKLELQVLRNINLRGDKPHIPAIMHAAKRRRYSYMIMTLLGENFKALRVKNEKPDGSYPVLSVSSWVRLGIQCLYALKLVHDHGYVHRDIKPNNFLMGHSSDPERSRIVFVLDFGLSRSYAFIQGDRWKPRLARATADFRGTIRYCSPNVHDCIEQGRRDDLWSLFYVLIELHCGLPWQELKDKDKIEVMKCNIKDADLMQNMPRELRAVIPGLRKLDYYARPDYIAIYNAFLAVMKRYKVNHDDPYDWEDKDKILTPSKKPAWYNPVFFFKVDPIGVLKPSLEAKNQRGGNHTRTQTVKTMEISKGTEGEM